MTTPKKLEQLRTEKERAETQLAQEQHKLECLENQKKFLEQGERKKCTHRLCNLSVTQTKRSAGQSAIASAAYRSGEKLYSEYYGEYVVYCERVE